MHTVTFYSYKGGTGRTLALANVAMLLAEMGKRVFVLDWDLEAPGLHYKLLSAERRASMKPGFIDLAYDYFLGDGLNPVMRHVEEIDRGPGKILLMPAGRPLLAEYWSRLVKLRWPDRFYEEYGEGFVFVADLKRRIDEECQPDFLLIDARTGVTEVGGVALTLLPDQVVFFFVNNPESKEGTREIIRSISRTLSAREKLPIVVPVLTRIPEDMRPPVEELRAYFADPAPDDVAPPPVEPVLVLHSDRELERHEEIYAGDKGKARRTLYADYLGFFESLNLVTREEVGVFERDTVELAHYPSFFARITGARPHDWQAQLGSDPACRDRLIRIPTGFGKTAGVVLTWLYHRVLRKDDAWPRRLVFCLPMRVLVEQTERAIRAWLDSAAPEVGLHVLMGGVKAERWASDPDRPAILLGTQDMLLSRALNRGYAAGRALWPMEYGLLHQDALWVLDEVQLMDVGLSTSAQLAAFRDEDARAGRRRLRPVHTWWMSATLQPSWLKTVDHPTPAELPLAIPAERRRGGLFEVRKPLAREAGVDGAGAIATRARELHVAGTLTLIVVNRVATAVEVHEALAKLGREGGPELRLVHSRFRGAERARWAETFLHRDAKIPDAGRIIVATQVIEAGVDISARTLVTEIAPWSSLVQRFGRVARYERESGQIVVAGPVPEDDKGSLPYTRGQLAAADEGIARLLAREADGSPRSLEAFEEELSRADPALLVRLYPYEPLHVIRRRDIDDLFDTSADLSGTDLDVSRFIRSGEERDVSVFWRALARGEQVTLDDGPRREELCPVPIGEIRAWKKRAYVLDYIDGAWSARDARRLVPGMTVLLDAGEGGYDLERGWNPKAKTVAPVPLVAEADLDALATASSGAERDDLSIAKAWKTIATHGREAEQEARTLSETLGLDAELARVVTLAARWHDVGKAHGAFQDAIRSDHRATAPIGARRDLAKAPDGAWRKPPYPERPGFRHELASTLALFEVLRRRDPFHPALLGPHRALLEAMGTALEAPAPLPPHPLADEIAALSADDFDLVAWLVCTHHGKVRCVWTSTPLDQEAPHGGIHGVREGDPLPPLALTNAAGDVVETPPLTLSLAASEMGVGPRYGASWGERVAGLLSRHGPFTLAFLEALLRAADWRASGLTTEDPLA